MKWDCGETWGEKKARLGKWHLWFAWRPVRVADHDCRWLEYIWRRGDYRCCFYEGWWDWEYSTDGASEVQP
jgi:hypothetical protein